MATSLLTPIIYVVTFHTHRLAYAIVHRVSVTVTEVGVDTLVRKKAPVLSDRETVSFQEPVQFVNAAVTRVLHNVLKELNHRLVVEPFYCHLYNALGDSVTNDLALVQYVTVLNRDVRPSTELFHNLRTVDCGTKCVNVVGLQCFLSTIKLLVSSVNSVRLTIKEHSKRLASHDVVDVSHWSRPPHR